MELYWCWKFRRTFYLIMKKRNITFKLYLQLSERWAHKWNGWSKCVECIRERLLSRCRRVHTVHLIRFQLNSKYVCVCVCCYQKYFNEGATRQAIDFYDFNCTFIDIFSVEFFLQLFTLFKLFFVYLKPHLFSYLKQRSIQECNPMPTVVNVYDDTENIISVVCLFISAEPNFRNELWKQFPKSGCDTISI